ncbi:hypothetical protein TNCV_587221 [Trichonephila clavipes]|nr:hypothetical protein TNCV_587221 [Trichonephila clavipes]
MSCQIVFNCWIKSSASRDGRNLLPKTSQMFYMGERPGDQAGQESDVVNVLLCCQWTRNDYQRDPEEMAPLPTPCCEFSWRAIVRAGSPRYAGSLRKPLSLSTEHSWKPDSPRKTIRPQSEQFHIYRTRHHCNRT